MTTRRFAVRMDSVGGPDGETTIRATVPVAAMLADDATTAAVQRERTRVETEYRELVANVAATLRSARSGDSAQAYWRAGTAIRVFQAADRGPLAVEGLLVSLAREVGISRDVLWRCERFAKLYPDGSAVLPGRTTASYLAEFDAGYRRRAVATTPHTTPRKASA